MTYGDGVSDVNIKELLRQHQNTKKSVTVTGIRIGGRFGVLDVQEGDFTISGYREKPKDDDGWINGGFMVMNPDVFDYLSHEEGCILEGEPMERLAQEGKVGIFRHNGFWQCMDTLRDKKLLEKLLKSGNAPWVTWE